MMPSQNTIMHSSFQVKGGMLSGFARKYDKVALERSESPSKQRLVAFIDTEYASPKFHQSKRNVSTDSPARGEISQSRRKSMAARSTRVTVRNQTGVTLHHIDDSLEHGIWTDPLSPPAEIGPGATMWWQSESDGVATGTEGHARYAVVGSNDIVTFHWDNPFVGANFYEQSVTGPFGIYFSGGTGNNTEATYSLIPNTRVAVPGYLPSTHGFAFSNQWPAEHITSITLPDPFALPHGKSSFVCFKHLLSSDSALVCPPRPQRRSSALEREKNLASVKEKEKDVS